MPTPQAKRVRPPPGKPRLGHWRQLVSLSTAPAIFHAPRQGLQLVILPCIAIASGLVSDTSNLSWLLFLSRVSRAGGRGERTRLALNFLFQEKLEIKSWVNKSVVYPVCPHPPAQSKTKDNKFSLLHPHGLAGCCPAREHGLLQIKVFLHILYNLLWVASTLAGWHNYHFATRCLYTQQRGPPSSPAITLPKPTSFSFYQNHSCCLSPGNIPVHAQLPSHIARAELFPC